MRFVYSSDIHGDRNKYEKLMELCLSNNIKYLVLGGDLFSKNADDRIPVQKEFIHGYMKEYYSKLKDNNIEVIGIVGNDDLIIPSEEYYEMIKDFPNVHDVNQKKYDVDGISFIGLNYVLDAPFKRKDNVALEKGLVMPEQWSNEIYVEKCQKVISVDEWVKYREENVPYMEDLLNNLPNPSSSNKVVYIFHDPPFGVGLDNCRDGCFAGSHAILDFLTKSNAFVSLHGHIHESPSLSGKSFAKLGNTYAIQVGQTELNESILHYAIVDTDSETFDILECDCVNRV